MFKKLLSNLPFNPSLIGQVSFYAKRMHKETAIRRLGLILIILAFFVQFFAFISPPEPTLAASANDVIPGGFSSQAQAVTHCNQNNYDFATILASFGIDCGRLAAGTVRSIRSTDYNRKLLSMGRLPYGKAGERSIVIAGKTYYQRYLWAWDTGPYSTYTTVSGTRADGTPFMVLFNCGNVTVVETVPTPTPPPTPPPTPTPPPPPTDVCPIKSGTQTSLSECDVCPNVSGIQLTNDECDVCPSNPGVQTSTSQCDLCPDISGVQTSAGDCDVCPNIPGTQSRTSQCDVCPNKTGIQTTQEQCDVCPNIAGVQTSTTQCDVCPNRSGTQTSLSECDVCPNVAGEQSSTTQCDVCPNRTGIQTKESDCDVCPDVSGVQNNTSQCDVCPNIAGTQSSEAECKPCEKSSDSNDTTACVILSKRARNITQSISNADGTMAKGNDLIEYTLEASNTGKVALKDFVVEENIGDLLEYADVTDFHGGVLDAQTKIVKWPKSTISANSSVRKQLTVKIKNPVPQTPVSTSNPGTGDMTMTNVYGNAVNVKLPPTVIKTTEQVTTKLPNTGPGETLVISFMITVVAAYFFARSRLLAKELDIVRIDYGSMGSI